MRIDYTTLVPTPPEQSKAGRAGQAGNAATGAAGTTIKPAAGDQASFSIDKTQVNSLADQVLAQPDIRQAKVQSLQQAINNDEYSIPASQIAEAFVSEFGGAA
jgi:flagellar biosynthesis anti-sigma factor FlgM